jgi:hypothetical protein
MKKKIESKTTEHTPLPWVIYQPPYSDQMQIRDIDLEMVYAVVPNKGNKAQARADAEFIVRAVNGHEALLRLVKRHREWIKRQGVPTAEDRDWARSADQIIAQDEGKEEGI